eukprot:3927118-Rhodomonas_salina.4
MDAVYARYAAIFGPVLGGGNDAVSGGEKARYALSFAAVYGGSAAGCDAAVYGGGTDVNGGGAAPFLTELNLKNNQVSQLPAFAYIMSMELRRIHMPTGIFCTGTGVCAKARIPSTFLFVLTDACRSETKAPSTYQKRYGLVSVYAITDAITYATSLRVPSPYPLSAYASPVTPYSSTRPLCLTRYLPTRPPLPAYALPMRCPLCAYAPASTDKEDAGTRPAATNPRAE